jgi:hypothetical protein
MGDLGMQLGGVAALDHRLLSGKPLACAETTAEKDHLHRFLYKTDLTRKRSAF